MDFLELNRDEESPEHYEACAEEKRAVHLLSSAFPHTDNIYEDLHPRIGEEYQAEIPTLLAESERILLQQSPTSTSDMLDARYRFGVGLAIPIMWVDHVGDRVNHERQGFYFTDTGADAIEPMDSVGKEKSLLDSKCCSLAGHLPVSLSSRNMLPQGPTCKVEVLNESLECSMGQELAGATGSQSSTVHGPLKQPKKAKGCIPLPGSPVVSWSDAEIQSFLLGLYIFGKNFVQVRKFMESKQRGDILSFYYGKFYRSEAHQRWSDCRKMRSRRFIHGQRIFVGSRQQELLSRLLPRIPLEIHNSLLEATKSFNEERTSLEEFVFSLKSMVGMEFLVEAVRIGNRKHDLTGTALDPCKSNQVISTPPEIPPIGRACSSLTVGDIVKFLTGGFRLSKARSSDLFWEAVWPRLLARGWHSEQPKNLSSVASKNGLVYIVPGIKKFSRKKLKKGNHYFDSVSDVLQRVASDPSLLELEAEDGKDKSSEKDEYGQDVDSILNTNISSEDKHNCYLLPKLPSCNSELVKITVVDTSIVQGKGPFKVRKLQSLPVCAAHSLISSNCLEETDSNSSEKQSDSDISPNDQGKFNEGASRVSKYINSKKSSTIDKGRLSDGLLSDPKQRRARNGQYSKDKGCKLLDEKQVVKDSKHQYSRRSKTDKPLVSKRRRLTACSTVETGRSSHVFSSYQLKEEDSYCRQKSVEANGLLGSEAFPSAGNITASSSAKGSLEESSEFNSHADCVGSSAVSEALSDEKPTLIDLNLPPDFDTDENFCTEMADSQDHLNPEESTFEPEKKQHSDEQQVLDASDGLPSVQLPTNNARRQSTRNRPPTAKALEALASGFLSTKRKWRNRKVLPSDGSVSKPSRQVRSTVSAPAPTTNLGVMNPAIVVSNAETCEESNDTVNCASMDIDSHVQSGNKVNTVNCIRMDTESRVWSSSKVDQAPMHADAAKLGTNSSINLVSNVGINGLYNNTRNQATMANESHVRPARKDDQDFLYCSEVLD